MNKPKEPTKIEESFSEAELDQAIDDCAKLLKMTRAQFIRLSRVMIETPGCIPKKS